MLLYQNSTDTEITTTLDANKPVFLTKAGVYDHVFQLIDAFYSPAFYFSKRKFQPRQPFFTIVHDFLYSENGDRCVLDQIL